MTNILIFNKLMQSSQTMIRDGWKASQTSRYHGHSAMLQTPSYFRHPAITDTLLLHFSQQTACTS